jgi:hypothetical protein
MLGIEIAAQIRLTANPDQNAIQHHILAFFDAWRAPAISPCTTLELTWAA